MGTSVQHMAGLRDDVGDASVPAHCQPTQGFRLPLGAARRGGVHWGSMA